MIPSRSAETIASDRVDKIVSASRSGRLTIALRGSNAASPVGAQRRRCLNAVPLCKAYDLRPSMELIETVSPELTRRLESHKAESAQDQSVGTADENKIREFRDLTTDGGMDIL